METKKADVRKKKRTPQFRRHEATKHHKKLSESWRKPRGKHSKMRARKKGKPCSVSIGYKSPEPVRGLTRAGKKRIRVFNVSDLKTVDAKSEQAVIASGVGRKKRLEIMKTAEELKIRVAN